MSALPSDRQEALLALHDRLAGSGVRYQLGGSAMLALRGIPVDIHDLDLVFPVSARDLVAVALADWWEGFTTIDHPIFSSDWYARVKVDDVPVDLVGGFKIKGEEPLPFRDDEAVRVAGTEIPLAPVDVWIRIYQKYDRAKAELLAQLLR
ncbi:MAG: hypothetical protein ACE5MI_11355 [Acidimicrobiia bacterium]